MSPEARIIAELRGWLPEMMQRHGVPGVALGVFFDRHDAVWGHGTQRIGTDVVIGPNTLFQIGSITKTFTATVLLALRDRGLLDLDVPVRSYVPSLHLANPAAEQRATTRHLLTHTGGWQGDIPGLPEDVRSIADFVAHLGSVPQLTPPGTQWSYNNAGFVLAGRVVEGVTQMPFAEAVREILLRPLGLSDTEFTEERPSGDVADVHVVGPQGSIPAKPWRLSPSTWPAGGLVSSAGDLLRYLQFHLGTLQRPGILSSEALQEMHVEQIRTVSLADAVGLGWFMDYVEGVPVISHTGDTVGHQTLALFVPERGFAVAILTNSSGGAAICSAVADQVLTSTVGLVRKVPEPQLLAADLLEEYEGRYRTPLWDVVVRRDRGGLSIEMPRRAYLHRLSPAPNPSPPARVTFIAPDRIQAIGESSPTMRGAFLRNNRNRIQWLLFAGRLSRKIADRPDKP